MISVISVINNDAIAKDFLLRSLFRQTAKYQLLFLDNKASNYKSASQAYNFESSKANGDYLMFIHQDVFLPSRNWLKKAEDTLSTFSNLGVAGVAGMAKPRYVNEFELIARYLLLRKMRLYSLWFRNYGKGEIFQGNAKLHWMGRPASEPSIVQTLDELLLIVPSEVFERTKFDDAVCDDWHLYGVDYSLTAFGKGHTVCVLPLPAWHLSSGKRSSGYYRTLKKLIKKHRNERVINTTTGLWPTRPGLLELLTYFLNERHKL